MAFESLSDKLQSAFEKLKGKGVITESDVNDVMREVKLALLEADVNFRIVKEFVADVQEKCLGADVMHSLTPAQQVIKIVNDELVDMMGGTGSKLTYSSSGFTTLMMVGLQGTGKTTTCGKLAAYLKQAGKKPMMAACDIYRPAAIDQLEVVGRAVNTPVFTMRESKDPVAIALAAKAEAEKKGFDVLIIDTAGIDVADAFAFSARTTDGDIASVACCHVTAAIDLIDVHGTGCRGSIGVSISCLLNNSHVNCAADITPTVRATKHSANGTAVDFNIGVARHVGSCYSTITTAEDITYLVATIDSNIGVAIGDMGCITAAIDIGNTVVAVVYFHRWCAITIISLVATTIDGIQSVSVRAGSRVCAINIHRYCSLRCTVEVVTAIDST